MCTGPSFSWLGRQIVNLEVAGSSPVGPAIHFPALPCSIAYSECHRGTHFPLHVKPGGMDVRE